MTAAPLDFCSERLKSVMIAHNNNTRTALVTGGAIRIGRQIALTLAQAGYNIALHFGSSHQQALQTQSEIRDLGANCTLIQADLSKPLSASSEIFAATHTHFGHVDVLVNSAAIFNPANLADTTEHDFDTHLDINLKAPLFLSQAFAKQLPPHHSGNIINILDWRSRKADPAYLSYSLSKSALWSMTELLALDLAPQIRVNGIELGAILPPDPKPADFDARISETVPLKTTGDPQQIAHAVLFLLNTPFCTGSILPITGGEHL